MNPIVAALLKSYRSTQEPSFALLEDERAFEHFATFLTIGPLSAQTVDTEAFVVGESNQPDVDVIATIVNGVAITEADEIDTYVEFNKYLDVDFVFVQAKTSPSFDVNALGALGEFVKRLFDTGTASIDNRRVQEFVALKDGLYEKAKYFTRRNPNVYIYYVTTGSAPDDKDKNFSLKIERIQTQLQKLSLFNEIFIKCVGASELQRLNRQMSSNLKRAIEFQRRVSLPKIPDVDQAFIGALPIDQFLSLLRDDSGAFAQTIFYDNVRDWQDLNEVNTGMTATVQDKIARARFVLMNNGVTVIARSVQETGDTLVLDDYQVVNGCQTSHVLWRCQDSLKDSQILVPVRLIATANESIVRDIIRATNSQTEVSQSQLLAVTDFQKQLEIFFAAQSPVALHYERRSRQYSGKPVEKTKIVTPVTLIKAFASMFLEEPHQTSRDFGSTLKKVGSTIFAKDHKHEPYYLSALALYWVQYLIRNDRIPRELHTARFHILLAARVLLQTSEPEAMSSKKIQAYSRAIISKFGDAAKAEKALSLPVKIVLKLAKKCAYEGDVIRSSKFTSQVRTAANKALTNAN